MFFHNPHHHHIPSNEEHFTKAVACDETASGEKPQKGGAADLGVVVLELVLITEKDTRVLITDKRERPMLKYRM